MKSERKITIPTFITICRFFLVPVFIYFFLVEKFKLAIITLVIAAISDSLDGYLARRYNMKSKLGAMLDPLADKFLMLVSFIALSYKNNIPWAMTLLVIGRDIYIILGVIYLHYIKKIDLLFKPTIISKLTTFSQLALLVLSFLQAFLFAKDSSNTALNYLNYAQIAFLYIASVMTLITFVQYTKIGLHFLKYGQRKPS